MVIFGPLLILIARAQRVSPVPYLLAAALLTDTGGIGTLVSDPPQNDRSLAITPALWFRKGTPAMLASLIAGSIVFVLFFEYFEQPLR